MRTKMQYHERSASYWVEPREGPLRGVIGAVTLTDGRWRWECPMCDTVPENGTEGRYDAAEALRQHVLADHPQVEGATT